MGHAIILNIREELNALKAAVVDLNFPPFDLDAFLSNLFDCLTVEKDFLEKLNVTCIDMADRDVMFENEALDEWEREWIFRLVNTIGMKLKLEYDLAKLYVDGIAPYNYKRIFNGCALIVAEFPNGFQNANYRTRYTGTRP